MYTVELDGAPKVVNAAPPYVMSLQLRMSPVNICATVVASSEGAHSGASFAAAPWMPSSAVPGTPSGPFAVPAVLPFGGSPAPVVGPAIREVLTPTPLQTGLARIPWA